jgi:hypothetical protein
MAILVAVALYAGWRLSVWRWPTRRCPSCKGTTRNAGSNSLRWRRSVAAAGKASSLALGHGIPVGYGL